MGTWVSRHAQKLALTNIACGTFLTTLMDLSAYTLFNVSR
jgi:hypothetical protein